MKVKIGKNIISINHKTYFVADIAANHDGSLSRAKKLIRLCAKAGANAAKFQHFKADTIVSNYGFKCCSDRKRPQSQFWSREDIFIRSAIIYLGQWRSCLVFYSKVKG